MQQIIFLTRLLHKASPHQGRGSPKIQRFGQKPKHLKITLRVIFRLTLLAFVFFASPRNLCAAAEEILIDAIVASVDGQPITLQELNNRLKPPRSLSLSQAASDNEARTMLDQIILEKLILAEGASRKMQVSDDDVEGYLNEIAGRNKMNRPDFEMALKKEGISIETYKEDIRLEILKSRLASAFVRGNVSVTDEEVEEYIENRVGKKQGSTQIQIRQIFIRNIEDSSQSAKAQIQQLKSDLDQGKDFAELAKQYSQSADKSDGGLLGVMEEKDLNPEVFDAVFPLKEGEHSPVVETGDGYRIFKVEKRFGGSAERDERLVSEVRAELQRRKMEEKFSSFFMQDLYKQHSVDKKI